MNKYIITEQDVLNANANMKTVLKYTLARYIAEMCVDKKEITIREDGEASVALPDMAQRNTLREAQFKTGVFVKEYLGKTFEPVRNTNNNPIPYLMSADDVDSWINFESQIDRLKRSKDKTVADKCYDMLNDYHAFCRMVSIEIEQESQIKNDSVGRFAWLLASLIKSTNPEELKKSLDELNEIEEKMSKKEE